MHSRFFVFSILASLSASTLVPAAEPSRPVKRRDSRVVDARVVELVERVAAQRQPTAADYQLDQIGWAPSILRALELAKEHQRPVFLFTHDGRMNLGRC